MIRILFTKNSLGTFYIKKYFFGKKNIIFIYYNASF